ncbi:hypothetical protein DITRI_Ditri20bG0050000 [Diplodiscus trichospermus]
MACSAMTQKLAKAEIFLSGLNNPGNTSNQQGSKVNFANVGQILGLDSGISLARIDYSPNDGLNPQMHPRATEILVVLDDTVCFVTSSPDHQLITEVLFVGEDRFPCCPVQYVFAGPGSQHPGVITIANSMFGSKLAINLDILAQALQLDKSVVTYLQFRF